MDSIPCEVIYGLLIWQDSVVNFYDSFLLTCLLSDWKYYRLVLQRHCYVLSSSFSVNPSTENTSIELDKFIITYFHSNCYTILMTAKYLIGFWQISIQYTQTSVGARKWLNGSVYVSVIKSLVVCSACFDTSLTICGSLTCSHRCHRLVHQRLCYVLLCLCNNACERSLPMCHKSRALCSVSKLLSVPTYM